MLERGREQDVERHEERARPQQPAPALQFGTPDWASAMGNQAVARLARQAVAEEEVEAEAESEELAAPELAGEEAAGEELEAEAAGGIPDDLPEELPA